MDAGLAGLIVVRQGSHLATEQRSLSRDVERGLLIRVRRGVDVGHERWNTLSPEQRHLVAMQALAAVSTEEPVFSHWSAAVALGLPVLERRRLARVHVTLPHSRRRSVHGATVHLLPGAGGETTRMGPLLVTATARTVVDVAAASPFVEGVVTADGALHAGTRRVELQQALERSGPRRAGPRVETVIGFTRRGAESAAESISRCTMRRLAVAPLELQHEVHDRRRLAAPGGAWRGLAGPGGAWRGLAGRLDFWDPVRRIGGEVDGAKKYLDPALAVRGAGRAVYEEKLREDRVRACIDRLARWGWPESNGPLLLGRVLATAGLLPASPRATLEDWIEAARPFG